MPEDKNHPKEPIDKETKRAVPELESDTNFTAEDQTKIVKMVLEDYKINDESCQEWKEQRKKDIQMYENERPSKIEGLSKESWMSDRNLGLCSTMSDIFQSTLLATCYTADTLHFVATEDNDKDHKDNLEKFAKWGLSSAESNFAPEADDFIFNRVNQGVSFLKIYWKVWYEWVDRRIPKYNFLRQFTGYNIKTEQKRFEKGVIENIDDVGDLLFPDFGNQGNLQEKDNLQHLIHKTADYILIAGDSGEYLNVDDQFVLNLRQPCYLWMSNTLKNEAMQQLGLKGPEQITETEIRAFPITLVEWYGTYEKNGKKEKWRFIVEPITRTFLAGKALRKIRRDGKYPFVGGPFIRRPGFVRGKSMPHDISDIVNAFNNVYNQKSDFQYVTNCPFGFYQPDEVHKKQVMDLVPGELYPTTDPESVVFPNLQRSMAWAESDFRILMEVLERKTGAASYFMTNSRSADTTATRDKIVNEKSETRFGLWVQRLIEDISEAITMWLVLYQDWAPSDLGSRVLGEDGKKLFPNLSIETLRGNYRARLTPDVLSGSKALDREIALWALESAAASPWFDPMINPKGSWRITANAFKKMGISDVEGIMPPEPSDQFDKSKDVVAKFNQIKQGEIPEIDPATDDIPALQMGFAKLKEERYYELDKEYQPIFDQFFFNINIAMREYMRKLQEEQIANSIAMEIVGKLGNRGMMRKPPSNVPPPAGAVAPTGVM